VGDLDEERSKNQMLEEQMKGLVTKLIKTKIEEVEPT
jgi:hypothetical protein